MKKSLLALVIASTLPMAAFADVVVYGKANVSLQNADEFDESQIELVSNASRIGVKGGEEISSGLKAIYQFEYQTAVDDGTEGAQTFSQRNIYVGLQGDFGTAIAGKFDTPTKTAQEKVDLFNDLEGDINYLVAGETRAPNIVQYTTPTFAEAFAVNVAFVAAETEIGAEEGEGTDDGIVSSLTYTTTDLYAAIAFEQDVTEQDLEILRLVARYTFNQFQFGALYEDSTQSVEDQDFGDFDIDHEAWLLSARYAASDKIALKIQYGDAGTDFDVDKDVIGLDALSVGIDYILSKNATLFAYYTEENGDLDQAYADFFELDSSVDDSWFGVGMELKF